MNLTKNDYNILILMTKTKADRPFGALTLKDIQKHLEGEDYKGLSLKKIRDAIKLFLENELVTEGVPDGIAKSYYITKKGVEELRKVL